MLATQMNHVVHDNKLVRNCIVRITQYQATSVKGKEYVAPNYFILILYNEYVY